MSSKHSHHPLGADPVRAALAVVAFAMTTLAETRDSGTSHHLLRIQHYVRKLARQLRTHPRFSAVLTPSYISLLFQSAPLYDMGTMGIPDRILLKPDRLTAPEMAIMRTHTTLARDALEQAEKMLGWRVELLQTVKEISYSHQEKWDGSGYPQGLAGEQIPLSARLIALADVYDALISERVYKAGVPHQEAVATLLAQRGGHFDPDVVDAFMAVEAQFQAIALRYADTAQDLHNKIEYMANSIAEEARL